jgi:hypothetical protein
MVAACQRLQGKDDLPRKEDDKILTFGIQINNHFYFYLLLLYILSWEAWAWRRAHCLTTGGRW